MQQRYSINAVTNFAQLNPERLWQPFPKNISPSKEKDGTYNVKICICHKGQCGYIETNHYVIDKKLINWFTVSDLLVNKLLYEQVEKYRESISIPGDRLDLFGAKDLNNNEKGF